MAAPENQIFVQGQGSVDADALNTFIQWASNVAGLRAYTGVPQMVAQISGYTVPNDGGQGFFYWDPNATAADDNGVTTVQPNGVTGAGRWIREPFSGNAATLTVTDNTDTVTEVTKIIFDGATVSPPSGTGTATVTVGSSPSSLVAFAISGIYPSDTSSFPLAVVPIAQLPVADQTIQVDTASACGVHSVPTFGNTTCFQAPKAGTYGFSLTLTLISGNLPGSATVIGGGGTININVIDGIIPQSLIQAQNTVTSDDEYSDFIIFSAGSVTVVADVSEGDLVFPTWNNEPPTSGDDYVYLYLSEFCGWLIG